MTATPVRLQLSRAKGFNLQAHSKAMNGLEARKVDRSTDFGNPCTCSRPYGCPLCPEFQRAEWEDDDGNIDPLRCCIAVFRHYVETGLSGAPTHTGRLGFAFEACSGYPNRTRLINRLPELRGKNCACWCHLCAAHKKTGKPLGVACANCVPCHVDPLMEIANR